jgi:hypothetical protein
MHWKHITIHTTLIIDADAAKLLTEHYGSDTEYIEVVLPD